MSAPSHDLRFFTAVKVLGHFTQLFCYFYVFSRYAQYAFVVLCVGDRKQSVVVFEQLLVANEFFTWSSVYFISFEI